MNNNEFIIGEMINDDSIRIKYSNFINDEFLKDERLLKLVEYLKSDEFSFENLLVKEGKDLLIYAISLSIESIKIKQRNKCI
jgi:hypothetical protein